MKGYNIKLSGFNDLNQEMMKVLMLCYTLLISNSALQLYLLLLSLKNQQYTNYEQLSLFTNLSYQELDIARKKLEQYRLVKTYIKENNTDFIYIDIQTPLRSVEFLNNPLFSRELFSKMNQDQHKQLVSLFDQSFSFDHFKEISDTINLKDSLQTIENNEQNYLNRLKLTEVTNFNYHSFISYFKKYLIPDSIKDDSVLQILGTLANAYNIEPEKMAQFVASSYIVSSDSINYKKLEKTLSKYSESLTKKTTITIDSHPEQYLQFLGKGVKPTAYEKKIIATLITEHKLDFRLINTLLEYCYQKDDKQILGYRIEEIVTRWKRKGITTIEQAKIDLDKPVKTLNNRKKQVVKQMQGEELIENSKVDVDTSISVDELLRGLNEKN